MPVTKTAKRALRSSKRKAKINSLILKNLEIAIRTAKKTKSPKDVRRASSLADRAAKKRAVHKNKSARIKSALSKLLKKEKRAEIKSERKTKKKSQKSKKSR